MNNADAGLIVTNNHVIHHAEKITVLIDGRKFDAKKLGTDPDTDVALIRVRATNLTAIQFGDSGRLEVGETVLRLGTLGSSGRQSHRDSSAGSIGATSELSDTKISFRPTRRSIQVIPAARS